MASSPQTHPTGSDVEDFLAEVANDVRREDARALCALMADATGEPPVMWGRSIIGFGSFHYRYESGREGDAALVSFSPRKPALVLYLAGGFEDQHQDLMTALGSHEAGKGCLYIKRLADVELTILRELIDRSVQTHRDVHRASTPTGPG